MLRPPFFLLLLLPACVSTESGLDSRMLSPGDPAAPSQVTPGEALATARACVEHPWRPFARNILHGPDANGILVHTPDVSLSLSPDRPGWWIPGEVNRGIPYKWGGFDDPGLFDQRVASGFAAGDVATPEKRAADNAAVSARATGLDCSGFVSLCLNLPKVHDTSALPGVCSPLANANELRPGDILNIPRGHVVLFAGWARRDKSWLYYYDTGGAPDYWRPSLKESPLQPMLALGYQPLRYRGMALERAPSAKAPLTRSQRAQVLHVPEPVIGEP